MKDDTKEKRWPGRYFRYGLLASLAVLVVSLGLALTPGPPPQAPEPAFSERARAAALAETMQLRLAGSRLADSVSGAERQALLRSVTLLTTQARALTGPDQTPSPSAAGRTSGTAADTGTAGAAGSDTGTASGAPSGSSSPADGQAAPVESSAELVAALSASGGQRLADAGASDGGMARLLAAVGTAQLLEASSLAPVVGAAAPALPASSAAESSAAPDESCPSATAQPGPPEGSATPAAALAMTVKTEAETVYGYQVALARLDGSAAGSAAELLARHETVLAEAEALGRAQCVDIPPREAGYTLGPLFLESPAAGLASLEAGTLPVYGDLVALSNGSTREWAISGLVAAAQRAALWGADSGPLPGIVVDTARLPELPETRPAPQSPGSGTAPAP
ncbi:ferritin-like domain-containing protein [Arthrobacter sp. ISL-72]|uniref:ferritin-like domain-containing protein n=1 Tax=Arthrobacter sp. ISL-72 TaxID=2819114 RepID=UPI001BE5D4CB|nr:ferritin-like domain-containing protein [Arthrobacter sp. ISL-72]MBT2595333.1 ferritin-like domain-containing protein [Arthrobacter sp. ISL-72]